jgi:hypothetical protein
MRYPSAAPSTEREKIEKLLRDVAQQQAGLARLQARVQASPVNDDKDKPAEASPTTTSRTPKATKPGLSPHLRILSPRPLNSLGSELEDIAESLNAKAH